ncbi:ROK family protein [Anaerococcus sp.]|uniref:ROK family protein n=1 Tax=Anaerococcus TaxID=165779 RepID=UPI00258A6234|nr:ROK family protein [Anaerococcus sp.]MDU3211260.1 ROK family protein [Anaerococcus sp.]
MDKVIGIDLGGTKINACLIDQTGRILERNSIETEAKKGRDVVLENIKKTIYGLNYKEAKAIGIGTPGFIDAENGVVTFAGNIDGWSGLNLKKAVEKFVDIPVFVENDANIALLAEKWIGACTESKDIVMVTLGTGVGGAVYNEKSGLLSGSHFQGAELGHVILHPGGDYCTCGQHGCAEAYCAGTALTKNYKKLTGDELTGEQILKRVYKDPKAKEVLEIYQEDLAYFLTSLRNIFDPEVIVIGGGVIHSKDIWWDGMIEKFNDICNNTLNVSVIPAKYLNDSGVIGAGKIAFERVENGK